MAGSDDPGLFSPIKLAVMEKKLYYRLSTLDETGGIMDLSGCLEWIKGDIESNYQDGENLSEIDLPEYTIAPVWMTDEDYEKLPEQ